MNSKKKLWILIAVSFAVRLLLAATLDLGNDEVYYRLYALYPDWSYFDHPLMVAWVIRIFSVNLLFQNELFLRLGSVVIGTVNLWVVYQIGKTLKDEHTGLYAAVLYTASVYAFVIMGVFILPDTPQGLFWLLSLWFLIKSLPYKPGERNSNKFFLLFGLVSGLGILSKYTSVFLWGGAVLYILFFNRKWLFSKTLYLSIIITAITAFPLFIWNLQNNFVSFTFHTERVDMAGYTINPGTFLREIAGEIFYNNPVNFVLILISVTAFLKGKNILDGKSGMILLFSGLPIIFVFILFSLFRATLPHWTAPGYTTLLFVAAAYLSFLEKKRTVKRWLGTAGGLLAVILVTGFVQIKTGIIPLNTAQTALIKTGSNDPSLDLYGFRQAGEKFTRILKNDLTQGVMKKNAVLIGNNWFPLANYDYYAAFPNRMKALAVGPLQAIHEYARINKLRGGFQKGTDAYYLTDTRYFRPPGQKIRSCFQKELPADTVPIYRNNKVAKYLLVYRFKNLRKIPEVPQLK